MHQHVGAHAGTALLRSSGQGLEAQAAPSLGVGCIGSWGPQAEANPQVLWFKLVRLATVT